MPTNLKGTHTPRRKYTTQEVKTMLFAPKEKGQGLVEYALILVLVAVVVIVILSLLGPAIGNIFSNIVGNI
jgi:pilus assembly protein Flp/PilA